MPKESVHRRALVRAMVHGLNMHAHPVESGDTCPGFPDVEYCSIETGPGLIEVKVVSEWPKRESTMVRLPKGYLKRTQVSFMRRRVQAGGIIGLALLVGHRDWFLLPPRIVLTLYQRGHQLLELDQTWLREEACRMSNRAGLATEPLQQALLKLKNHEL